MFTNYGWFDSPTAMAEFLLKTAWCWTVASGVDDELGCVFESFLLFFLPRISITRFFCFGFDRKGHHLCMCIKMFGFMLMLLDT